MIKFLEHYKVYLWKCIYSGILLLCCIIIIFIYYYIQKLLGFILKLLLLIFCINYIKKSNMYEILNEIIILNEIMCKNFHNTYIYCITKLVIIYISIYYRYDLI